VGDNRFVDYYETLQVSPEADSDTISRVFRHLAKRYHPDNLASGDRERFEALVEANRVLTDPELRAAYDATYQNGRESQMRLFDEAIDAAGGGRDRILRARILSVLLGQRRRDVENPSMGNIALERLLSCPREHLEFHIWYLKEKKLIERTDLGVAITALGVDEADTIFSSNARLLAEHAESAPLMKDEESPG
jgi:curved DNA-binding protein CbpA